MTTRRPSPPAGVSGAALYCRVSSEEQVDGFSLDAQVRGHRGALSTGRTRDRGAVPGRGQVGPLGRPRQRPAFRPDDRRCRASRFDVVVVHKLDRFARNLRLTLEILDRLEKAGVGFVSVSEAMDFSTAMGRVVLSTMGSLAQFYSDNLSARLRRASGAKGPGPPQRPAAVRTQAERGRHPGPRPRHLPGSLARLPIGGRGQERPRGRRGAQRGGVPDDREPRPQPFTKDTSAGSCRTGSTSASCPDGPGVDGGVHEPVLDGELFDRAEQARTANRRAVGPRSVVPTRARTRSRGLARAGHCGGRLHLQTDRHGSRASIATGAARDRLSAALCPP
jgi:DNA invertase Pin-like site-specific DNA recombinase